MAFVLVYKKFIALTPIFQQNVFFLAAALAACSSSQYHVVLLVVVLVVPELLSKFEFFGFLRVPWVTIGLHRINSG